LLRKVLIISISLKILILITISLLKNGDIGGYNTNSIESDDVRYETGALYYSQNANSIIDEEVFTYAFEQFGDYTGYSESFSFWYWFVCIVTYLFKYTFVLRIINILFSALTAYYIYKLGSILFNKKAGKYALIIYSFNPYFLFFPLFLYKDQFIALIMVQLFYYLYIYFTSNKKKYLFYVLIVLSLITFLRSGFSILLIASVLVLSFIREKEYSNRFKLKKVFYFLLILIIFIFCATFYFIDNFDIIQRKLLAYVIERANSESDTIAMFQISSLSDFYKLPFSFIFALLQPINLTSKILSVSGFVGVINLFGIFLASGNILALFDKKIRGLNFTWIINALFIITLITSLGISRHYYFMLPFYVIFLSAYIIKGINLRKTLLSSLILAFLIGVYFFTKII
jgi:4-amino-4-deoxy-L-arabinose transferase-like glycosyltransferase